MLHIDEFYQDLHCVLRFKQPSGTEICHNLENNNCEPLKYTMVSPILIVLICMVKSIRIQRLTLEIQILTLELCLLNINNFKFKWSTCVTG